MIAKKYRLPRKDFLECIKLAKVLSTPLFTLKYKTNAFGNSRWSIVVSKKISKKATERNKMKRRVYKILAKYIFLYKIDGIIYPKPAVLNLDYAKLSFEIDSLVSKISVVS